MLLGGPLLGKGAPNGGRLVRTSFNLLLVNHA